MSNYVVNPRITLVAGSWSSNIGNAFYNLGAEWLLRELGYEVSFFPESPRWKEDLEKSYDPIGDLETDLVVLAGPCLWRRLQYVYEGTFEKLYRRGIRVGYLTGGMAEYSESEADEVARFFERFPPLFISTRDQLCYDLLAPRVQCPIHSGICTSMFLNDAHPPQPLDRDPYVVFNFDQREPEVEVNEMGRMSIIGKKAKRPPLVVGGKEIIRLINLSIDEGYRQIYQRPNSYHSDLPQGYCSILAHADAVYSERVHTCATALIYGGRAQFLTVSSRSHEKRKLLFERVGIPGIFDGLVSLDMDYVGREKDAMARFLRVVISGA